MPANRVIPSIPLGILLKPRPPDLRCLIFNLASTRRGYNRTAAPEYSSLEYFSSVEENLMLNNQATVPDVLLFSYIVASADMRYVEVSQREIHLRNDPEQGLVLRGEFSGCGPDCYVDLSQIFLEYAMSCEGCKDHLRTEEAMVRFGERLGEVFAAKFPGITPESLPEESLAKAFVCVLNSMKVAFREERSEKGLHFILDYCPLCNSGSKTGMGREMAVARAGFAGFAASLVHSIAPTWTVQVPKVGVQYDSLLEISIQPA